MRPFVELVGSSGATYRFRKAETELTPIGGNFVYVRGANDAPKVVCCGKARSIGLVVTSGTWFADDHARPEDQLFVRLNAVAHIRDLEHEDLILSLPRPFVIYEMC